jgi:hypothetical protein
MRLIATLCALLTVSTGCASQTATRAGIVCAAASTLTVASYVAARNEPTSDSEPAAPGPAVYVFGAALLTALISGGVAAGAEMAASPGELAPPTVVTGAPGLCDPFAEQLIHEAQHAARLGQCVAVQSFGRRVLDIDPGCYQVQFVAIRCSP